MSFLRACAVSNTGIVEMSGGGGSDALAGATMLLFLVDIHTGKVILAQFRWVNDFVTLLAVLLVLSGPILWWRQKWR
jgi:uncharacterized iron-regulated membrane protein